MSWAVAVLLKPLILFVFLLGVRFLAKGIERVMPPGRLKSLLFSRISSDR